MRLSQISSELSILISEQQIQEATERLGREITQYYANFPEPLTIVGTLKGSALFVADLIRKIDLPLRLDFVELSSYGNDVHTSGTVKINKDIKSSVKGQHVLLVEDIIDTGITFDFLLNLISGREAVSVEMACLLRKPEKHRTGIPVRFCGYEIEDHFVVGYGLDYRGLFRNLPCIAILDEETRKQADLR